MTRRLQFGLKDEKEEKKADQKKERKRKQNDCNKKDETGTSKGKNKAKSDKSKVPDKKDKAKTSKGKGKKCRSKGLKKLRSIKQSSPRKETTIEQKPLEANGNNEPSGSTGVAPAKKSKKGKGKHAVDDLPKAIIESYTNKIEAGINKCCVNDCEHSWEVSDFVVPDQYQISAYWSRSAIGVKVSNNLLAEDGSASKKTTDKKTEKTIPKSKNFSQVGYFACGCTYMSMVAAHTLALQLHVCVTP